MLIIGFSTLSLANNFLERSFNEKIPITHMKLQKLIYILYKTHLQTTGESLFFEDFEAWECGAVLRSVYYVFGRYGKRKIKEYSILYNRDGKDYYKVCNEEITETFFNNINGVWALYKDMKDYELCRLTQCEGGAWYKAIENESYILKAEDILKEEDYFYSMLLREK